MRSISKCIVLLVGCAPATTSWHAQESSSEIRDLPSGPVDLRAEVGWSASAAASLRGAVVGESVLLTCKCLPTPLRVAVAKGRFGVDGLPAGEYTAEIHSGASVDACVGRLAGGERIALLQGHVVVHRDAHEFGTHVGARARTDEVPRPCEFVVVEPADAGDYSLGLDSLWDGGPTD